LDQNTCIMLRLIFQYVWSIMKANTKVCKLMWLIPSHSFFPLLINFLSTSKLYRFKCFKSKRLRAFLLLLVGPNPWLNDLRTSSARIPFIKSIPPSHFPNKTQFSKVKTLLPRKSKNNSMLKPFSFQKPTKNTLS